MNTARERVEAELSALLERAQSLKRFMDSGGADALGTLHEQLLTGQYSAMVAYAAFLTIRLDHWELGGQSEIDPAQFQLPIVPGYE